MNNASGRRLWSCLIIIGILIYATGPVSAQIYSQELPKLPGDENQEEVVKDVFNFLELQQKHKSSEDKVAKKLIGIINTTTKGNPLEKWKKHLSSAEIESIDHVIEENKEQYNEIIRVLS